MARLIFRNGPFAGKGLVLPEGKPLTVGRNHDLELPLPDLRLSRRHCQIENTITGFVLRDLASTNGTFINGKRLETEVALNHLDVILIGNTELEFQMPEAIDQGKTRIEATETARTPVVLVAAQVSPAPERAAGGSTAENMVLPLQQMPIKGCSATAAASVQSPAAMDTAAVAVVKDPLAVAIAELGVPLPPEPVVDLPPWPQMAFCDQCDGSIPIVDLDLCIAKAIDSKLFCRECVAKGIPGGAQGAPKDWGASPSAQGRGEVLNGLDQFEEIDLGDGGQRGSSAHPVEPTSRQVPVGGPPKTESALERLLNEEPKQRTKPKLKAPASPNIDELLGDEFEEIG